MTKDTGNGAEQNNSPAPDGFSLDVRLWKVTKAQSKTRPHQLRWKVGGKVSSATFATVALAESRRSELWQAMRRGEAFRITDGLPESEVRAEATAEQAREELPWFAFCREYMAMRWPTAAAKTREGIADGLAAVTLAMVEQEQKMPSPEELRLAFRWAVIPKNAELDPSEELEDAYGWISKKSLLVSSLEDPKILRDVQYRISFKLDGTPAAGETSRRRRRALNTAVEYAIERKLLTENPLTAIKKVKSSSSDRVDPRVLVNKTQAAQLLAGVSYVGTWDRKKGRRLVGFYAVMYFAGLRPSEAVGLRKADCFLPEKGWGVLTLHDTHPVSGKQWTDSGERHDKRGLKSREAKEDRPVPIPPPLVAMLRAHLKEFGTAKDGRLFTNERGGLVGSSTYWRVWRDAREYALSPDLQASILGGRPYDLRHTCITTWLNAGVPVAEVARRVGNSPEVIHRVYEGCIYGQEEAMNKKIERELDWPEGGSGS
ncbi:tyrosine-type recombinase/integrase [Streptomyces sp. RLB3-17]|uniref:tyrosine-type recombinase/integrase n=1 Tax=Streptomyces sp. RLB3-17 TaxID=2594455 RepID=UPI001161F6D1|nr:tyrosine-type recombinase/integrase [Streptomyces sp. RLB3-17]QDO42571.1 tyrosine-type recombinase/integrase [Streptomyces sp. RLB3-17]